MRRFYAVGDVHGLGRRLEMLHSKIIQHIQMVGGEATVVHLGDYVDRGPDSKRVIDACIEFSKKADELGFEAVFLKGNHEDMFLTTYDSSDFHPGAQMFMHNGGTATIESYTRTYDSRGKAIESEDIVDWRSKVPKEHIEFLRDLKTDHWADEEKLYFVHAGIDPITFPNCHENVKLWTREHRRDDYTMWNANEALNGVMVVHGHTPNRAFQVEYDTGRRLNLDTGAVFGGLLTCGIIVPGESPTYLTA